MDGGALPGALSFLGCRAAPGRRAEGDLIPADRAGPAAPQGACLKLRPGAEVRARHLPGARASHPEEEGRAQGFGASASKHLCRRKARPRARDTLTSVSRLWVSLFLDRPFNSVQTELFLRTRPK